VWAAEPTVVSTLEVTFRQLSTVMVNKLDRNVEVVPRILTEDFRIVLLCCVVTLQ
jgi:hypothetical protein